MEGGFLHSSSFTFSKYSWLDGKRVQGIAGAFCLFKNSKLCQKPYLWTVEFVLIHVNHVDQQVASTDLSGLCLHYSSLPQHGVLQMFRTTGSISTAVLAGADGSCSPKHLEGISLGKDVL